MRSRACVLLLVAVLGAAALAVLSGVAAPENAARTAGLAGEPGHSRLAVLVVFDQMRGDYPTRWQDLFGSGGFRRLQREGASFVNCHYPYATTVTGAGHATLATGCPPEVHGIVANEWYDRAAAAEVNCVGTDRHELLRAPEGTELEKSKLFKRTYKAASPERLLAPGIGDAVRAGTGGRGKVVALSFKDRGAVLPGGQRPDACCWCDTNGLFTTSTYYRDRLPAWVTAFNASRPGDRWLGKSWERLRPDVDYVARSGADDCPGEGKGASQDVSFPHPYDGGPKGEKVVYYEQVYNSPAGNEVLLELARRAVEAEGLGGDDVPDLLCLSFSSNDAVGHCWGPDSQEVMDVTLRSDLIVRDLLAFLDARVGAGRYTLVVSADHGICPLPEVRQSQGLEGGRVPATLFKKEANAFLTGTFGGDDKTAWVEYGNVPWVYLNPAVVKARGREPAEVRAALAGWLRGQRGVEAVYTREELEAGVSEGDEVGRRVRRSYHPDRAGDVAVVLKPYYLPGSGLTGTTHGSPHSYDTHVPLLVYGPGVVPGERKDPVTPLAAAPILAAALGVPPPAKATAEVPAGLFRR